MSGRVMVRYYKELANCLYREGFSIGEAGMRVREAFKVIGVGAGLQCAKPLAVRMSLA